MLGLLSLSHTLTCCSTHTSVQSLALPGLHMCSVCFFQKDSFVFLGDATEPYSAVEAWLIYSLLPSWLQYSGAKIHITAKDQSAAKDCFAKLVAKSLNYNQN